MSRSSIECSILDTFAHLPYSPHLSQFDFHLFLYLKILLVITMSVMMMKPNNLRYYQKFHHGFGMGTLNLACRYDKCLNKNINCDETKSKACISKHNQKFCCITFCIFSAANGTFYLYTVINTRS